MLNTFLNVTDQFFLLTSFFVLIREAFKQSTEDEKENGWDRIKALFDVRSVLSVQKKNYSIYFLFLGKGWGQGVMFKWDA